MHENHPEEQACHHRWQDVLKTWGEHEASTTTNDKNIAFNSILIIVSNNWQTLFLVVRPGAPSSILAPSSDALCS